MQKLSLLFTKDGLQWHISKGKSVLQEASFFITEETSPNLVEEKLDEILSKDDYKEINVFSALNHFSLTPDTFAEHELGYQLISYNAPVNEENEELMLSVNKRFAVQFYYTFPKHVTPKEIPLRHQWQSNNRESLFDLSAQDSEPYPNPARLTCSRYLNHQYEQGEKTP